MCFFVMGRFCFLILLIFSKRIRIENRLRNSPIPIPQSEMMIVLSAIQFCYMLISLSMQMSVKSFSLYFVPKVGRLLLFLFPQNKIKFYKIKLNKTNGFKQCNKQLNTFQLALSWYTLKLGNLPNGSLESVSNLRIRNLFSKNWHRNQ